MQITQEWLKSRLAYNPDTGIFTWLMSPAPNTPTGSVAGCLHAQGYIDIKLRGIGYKAHRLAWLYMLGVFPENEIDHIDQDRSNNRWSNLRQATHTQNQHNRKLNKNNTSGVKGVSFNHARRRWAAYIRLAGRTVTLGYFRTLEEAEACRMAAEMQHRPYSPHNLRVS